MEPDDEMKDAGSSEPGSFESFPLTRPEYIGAMVHFYRGEMFRLRRNYVWLYGIVLITWIVKLFMHPTPAAHFSDMFQRMGIGPIPPWFVLMLVALFYVAVVMPLFTTHGQRAGKDEIKGLERELRHWKL